MSDWTEDAACLAHPPEMFFPHDTDDPKPALDVCAGCPVKDPCLEVALRRPESGIWGGKTEAQRKDVRRRRQPQYTVNRAEDLCGTEYGARHHRARKQRVCPRCLDAERLVRAIRTELRGNAS